MEASELWGAEGQPRCCGGLLQTLQGVVSPHGLVLSLILATVRLQVCLQILNINGTSQSLGPADYRYFTSLIAAYAMLRSPGRCELIALDVMSFWKIDLSKQIIFQGNLRCPALFCVSNQTQRPDSSSAFC